MKSPLRRFRGFALHHHHHHRERKDHRPPSAKLDELVYAAQEMEDMRNCYDSLLSAAAATTNSVYEFAEAMGEMGTCLLEKAALNYDDDESGKVLMKLGKAQFELQKFVDDYRTNIINTITNPSESLLKELQVVEEMKDQCDQKRVEYEAMRAAYGEKGGRLRHLKNESFSLGQLQTSFLEYQEEAALFIFRLKSLKQGQFLSILTQAARHHASQLSFFRKGLKHLEALEPCVKAVAEKQHIDYHFSGLDNNSDIDDYSSYQDNHSDGSELSFNYEINDRDKDLPTFRSPMDMDQAHPVSSPRPLKEQQENAEEIKATLGVPHMKPEIGTQSAPIFAENVPDPSMRFRKMNLLTRTVHSYKLPTPADDKNPASVIANKSPHSDQPESKSHVAVNLWHSSPLAKDFMPNSMHSGPVKMPSSNEGVSLAYSYSTTDFKKVKREAFSGPIPSKVGLSTPLISATDRKPSGKRPSYVLPTRPPGPGWQSSVPPKATPRVTSLPTTTPRISELHELPRPPANAGLVGYSGPLVSRRPMPTAVSTTRVSPPSHTASPLPRPPAAMTRSYSIPSNSQRTPIITVNKLLEARHSRESSEVSSPPVTPISLADVSRRPTTEAAV
uniref:Hydroxyproline-rich glycoprotein family protein n=1 Tax=Zea mays TaxID=4577 RepID=B6UC71_MAIZE|nr:hypothetical protein [Zea mays]|eukprot:NP_001145352.1 uncharacterized protein LOC100278683 [Zea mays]